MLVQRVLPKIAPYMIATAAMLGISATKLPAANDKFEKADTKNELTTSKKDREDKEIPWLDIYTVGAMLVAYGVIRLATYIEKKENKEEKSEQIKPSEIKGKE